MSTVVAMSTINCLLSLEDKELAMKVLEDTISDERFEEEIADLGFDIGDNVNKGTVAVMAASTTTGKAKKAIEKGLPVFKPNEIDDLIDFLRRLK